MNSRNNLTYAYRAAGDLTRAVPWYEAALNNRRRRLGDDHPLRLTVHGNFRGLTGG
jgi:hypothetical protein